MKIYRAKYQIDRGLSDGSVISYAPGDEVPAAFGKALPHLVDVIEIAGVERTAPKADKQDADMPLSRANLETLQSIATPLGIDVTDKTRKMLIEEIEAAQQAQSQQKQE